MNYEKVKKRASDTKKRSITSTLKKLLEVTDFFEDITSETAPHKGDQTGE